MHVHMQIVKHKAGSERITGVLAVFGDYQHFLHQYKYHCLMVAHIYICEISS